MTLVQDVNVTELYDAQRPAITAATEPRMKIVARLGVALLLSLRQASPHCSS